MPSRSDETIQRACRVDMFCDRFETAWKGGQCPRIEDVLNEAIPSDRQQLCEELVRIELEYRRREGQTPRVEEYSDRFSSFSNNWLSRLFVTGSAPTRDHELDATITLSGLSAPTGSNDPTIKRAIEAHPPRFLGDYEILREIARGGMGIVYQARQLSLNRIVALKMILAGKFAGQAEIARFYYEATAVAQLDHPHIVPIYEVGEHAGQHFFAMAYVDGASLVDRLASGPLPPCEAARILRSAALAIDYAHSRGVLHRDLKPSNILMDADGRPRITDFGLAKRLSDDRGLTKVGQIVGTPSFMPPEQASGHEDRMGPPADIYALGAVLYSLLTGRPPFQAASTMETLRQVMDRDPVAPQLLNGAVPRDLETITLKCLEKPIHRRYSTAREVADELGRFLEGQPILARPVGRIERLWRWSRRNPLVAGLTCAVAGLLMLSTLSSSILTTWALRSERRALDQLFRSKVKEARSLTLSGRPGQRFRTLTLADEARDLATRLNLPSAELDELRNVAISARTLPDLYPAREWPGFISGTFQFDFDDTLEIYARTDVTGKCSIRRIDGDSELCSIPGSTPGSNARTFPRFSRDGRFVALYAEGGAARLWNISDYKPSLITTLENVWSIDFHPHNSVIALTRTNGVIEVYDLHTGQTLHRLEPNGLTREVVVALHPIEPWVAVGSYFGQFAQVRDLVSGSVVATLPLTEQGGHVAWHPSGQWLCATDGATGRVQVFDRATFQKRYELETTDQGSRFYFDHQGNHLAVVGWMSHLRLVDFHTGKMQFEFADANPTYLPRFSQDDMYLAGFMNGSNLRIHQIGSSREYNALARSNKPAKVHYSTFIRAVSPDSRLLVVALTDGFGFWDLESGTQIGFLPAKEPRSVDFEPPAAGTSTSDAIFIAESSGMYRWPIDRNRASAGKLRLGPPEPLNLPPGKFSQSRDGRVRFTGFRAVAEYQPWAGIWLQHMDNPSKLQHLLPGADLIGSDLSADGSWLVTANNKNGSIQLWDTRTGTAKRDLTGRIRSLHVQFSCDGRWLAIGGLDGRLIDLQTWDETRTLDGTACFSPDSHMLLLNQGESILRLYDLVHGTLMCELQDPVTPMAQAFSFTPDGRRIISVNVDAGIRVWDLPLLRASLAEHGLDWNAPPFPARGNLLPSVPSTARVGSLPVATAPLSLEIDLGDLEALRPQQMEANLNRAVQAAPYIAIRWGARSQFYFSEGRYAEAISDLREAVRCAEAAGDARLLANFTNELARRLVMSPAPLRDPEESIRFAKRGTELRPGEWSYVNTLGIAYYRGGRFADSVATLEYSLANVGGESDPSTLYVLAMCHHHLGSTEKARAYLEQARKSHENHRRHVSPDSDANDLVELRQFQEESEQLLGAAHPSVF